MNLHVPRESASYTISAVNSIQFHPWASFIDSLVQSFIRSSNRSFIHSNPAIHVRKDGGCAPEPSARAKPGHRHQWRYRLAQVGRGPSSIGRSRTLLTRSLDSARQRRHHAGRSRSPRPSRRRGGREWLGERGDRERGDRERGDHGRCRALVRRGPLRVVDGRGRRRSSGAVPSGRGHRTYFARLPAKGRPVRRDKPREDEIAARVRPPRAELLQPELGSSGTAPTSGFLSLHE